MASVIIGNYLFNCSTVCAGQNKGNGDDDGDDDDDDDEDDGEEEEDDDDDDDEAFIAGKFRYDGMYPKLLNICRKICAMLLFVFIFLFVLGCVFFGGNRWNIHCLTNEICTGFYASVLCFYIIGFQWNSAICLSTTFSFIALSLGQSYECPNTDLVTLKNIYKTTPITKTI